MAHSSNLKVYPLLLALLLALGIFTPLQSRAENLAVSLEQTHASRSVSVSLSTNGDKVLFVMTLKGYDGLIVRPMWQYQNETNDWANADKGAALTLQVPMNSGTLQSNWQAQVTVLGYEDTSVVTEGSVRDVSKTIASDKISLLIETAQAPVPATEVPATPPPATETPVTPPPVTKAPVTPPPATEAPVTPPPVTEAPVTPSPVTEVPVSSPPATEAPETPPPVTKAPVTPPPATEAPVTPPPVTEAPETPPPATEALEPPQPATEAPDTPPPATESPETVLPATEAPMSPPPVTEAPESSPPATESPTAETTATVPPAAEQAATDTTAEEIPVTDVPVPDMPPAGEPDGETPAPDAHAQGTEGDLTLISETGVDRYLVRYYGADGAMLFQATGTLGQPFAEPAETQQPPSPEGLRFAYWYQTNASLEGNPDSPYDFSAPISGLTYLKARFLPVGMPEESPLPAGSLTLQARVALLYGNLSAGQFAFELLSASGEILQTVKNRADGAIVFAPLPLAQEDAGKSFTYTMRQVIQEAEGLTQDRSVFSVQARIFARQDGVMDAEVIYPEDVTFDNVFAGGVPFVQLYTSVKPGQTLAYGSVVQFLAVPVNCGMNPVIRWQFSADNKDWQDIAGADKPEYKVELTPQNAAGYWRVSVTIAD